MEALKLVIITLCLSIATTKKQEPAPSTSLDILAAAGRNSTKTWIKIFDVKSADGLPENSIFSVFAIHYLLTWLSLGTGGDSTNQIRTALGFTQEESVIVEAAKEFQNVLATSNGSQVQLSNGLFVQKDFILKTDFLSLSTEAFKAEVQSVDFQTPDALKLINTWASESTGGKIPEVLKETNPLTVAVLLNVLYYKGKWAVPFPIEKTKKEDFHGIDGKKTSVDFITREGPFEFIENPKLKAKVVIIPYDNPDLIFTLILPNEGEPLQDIEASLGRKLKLILKTKPTLTLLSLSLPKFTIKSDFDLNEGLKSLGIIDIFDKDKANLTRLADKPLYVTKVVQKAAIELDEVGTEVSTASAVEISEKATIPVQANRPFIFSISSVKYKTPLFLGRVTRIPEARKRRKMKSKHL